MLSISVTINQMAHEQLPVEAQYSSIFSDTPGYIDTEFSGMDDHPQDECGVIAVFAPAGPVLQTTMRGMQSLQHRGHSGAGISYRLSDTESDSTLVTHKGTGVVKDAVKELIDNKEIGFTLDKFQSIVSTPLAIGHVRYSTAESENWRSTQPFRGEKTGLSLAHNGHIDNLTDVATTLGVEVHDDETETDSSQLTQVIDARSAVHGNLETALQEVLPLIEGAYSLTMTDGKKVVAARDVWGFHPLALGRLEAGGHVVASEAVAFAEIGASFVRDIKPGEIVTIDEQGVQSSFINRIEKPAHCAFEYIYTARPDGVVDDVNVRQSRENQGYFLAVDQPAPDAQVVVAVPNSGKDAARGFAKGSGLILEENIVRKVQSTRTFQMRGLQRDEMIRQIYHFEPGSLHGIIAVLVDDSMIKGSTMDSFAHQFAEITGAAGIHLRFAAPAYRYPCHMGMDTHDTSRLISRHMTPEQIADKINNSKPDGTYPNVLSVGFNTPERIQEATGLIGKLCTACATGEYPIKLSSTTVVDLAMPTVLSH